MYIPLPPLHLAVGRHLMLVTQLTFPPFPPLPPGCLRTHCRAGPSTRMPMPSTPSTSISVAVMAIRCGATPRSRLRNPAPRPPACNPAHLRPPALPAVPVTPSHPTVGPNVARKQHTVSETSGNCDFFFFFFLFFFFFWGGVWGLGMISCHSVAVHFCPACSPPLPTRPALYTRWPTTYLAPRTHGVARRDDAHT